jgi:hypothetical protein
MSIIIHKGSPERHEPPATPTKPSRCYPSQHLHPREWGLLEVCLRMTSGGKTNLFLDGRNMAERFTQTSKSAIYRSVARLRKAGWLVLKGGAEQDKTTGRYEKSVYQVLTHEAWTAKYGTNKCTPNSSPNNGNGPVPKEGTEAMDSSPNNEQSSPIFDSHQSHFCNSPVPPLGHNSVIHNSVKDSSVKTNPVSLNSEEGSFFESGERSVSDTVTETSTTESPTKPVPPDNPNNPTCADILDDEGRTIGWILLDKTTVFIDGHTGKTTLRKVKGEKKPTYFAESGDPYRTVSHA